MSLEIHIPVCNNPSFIKLQSLTLNKRCKTPFTIKIFNDAKDWPEQSNNGDPTMRQQIRDTCKELGITCIDVPNSEDRLIDLGSSQRHARTMNFMYNNYQKHSPNFILALDSDMFPIRDFSLENWVNYDIGYVPQNRGFCFYMWPNLYFLNPKNIPETTKNLINWNKYHGTDIRGMTVGTDSGGQTFNFLMNNTSKTYYINHLISLQWNSELCPKWIDKNIKSFLDSDYRNQKGMYFGEIYDDLFLHYRAGTNWTNFDVNSHNNNVSLLISLIHNSFETSTKTEEETPNIN